MTDEKKKLGIRGFAVTIETVENVKKHPYADVLDVVKLKDLDWVIVTSRDEFKPLDRVVYFPLDSVLPLELASKLNLKPGATSNTFVVKALKLKGIVSQGVIAADSKFAFPPEQTDLTTALEVTKFELPDKLGAGCLLQPLRICKYDLESAGNFPQVVQLLMDEKVAITEKAEGTNMAVTCSSSAGEIFVSSRNNTIIELEDQKRRNEYWEHAHNSGLIRKLQEMQTRHFVGKTITIRGELIGPKILNNIYQLEDREFLAFDILVDGTYLSTQPFLNLCTEFEIETAPYLCHGEKTLGEWLDGKSISEASNGESKIGPTKREGIVIRPVEETMHPKIGRIVIKQRSPDYLAHNPSKNKQKPKPKQDKKSKSKSKPAELLGLDSVRHIQIGKRIEHSGRMVIDRSFPSVEINKSV